MLIRGANRVLNEKSDEVNRVFRYDALLLTMTLLRISVIFV